jgi:hypothetical protein
MASTKHNADAARIDHAEDGDRRYLVRPDNSDLFVRTGKQIIGACQLGISVEVWLQELNDLCDAVADWVRSEDNQVHSCYCSPVGQRITFFFAPVAHQFDFDLAEKLAELVLTLHRFNVGMVELQQAPWNELDRFLNVQSARHIAGEKFSPSEAMEA